MIDHFYTVDVKLLIKIRFVVIWLSYQDIQIYVGVISVQIYMFPLESFVCLCVTAGCQVSPTFQ